MNDQEIEQEIQAKGLTAPRVTPDDIEANISEEYYFSASDHISNRESVEYAPQLDLITFCVLIMRNGHRIVGVNTGPVSADNFDAELGRKLARQNATDQIWPLLGFALRERLLEPATE